MVPKMLPNGDVAKVVAKMGSGKRVSCAVSFNELNFMQVICRWSDTPSRPLLKTSAAADLQCFEHSAASGGTAVTVELDREVVCLVFVVLFVFLELFTKLSTKT